MHEIFYVFIQEIYFDDNSRDEFWTWRTYPWKYTRGSLKWLKKSSKEVLTREDICMYFSDGSKFEPFSFSLILARNIHHVTKPWDGSKSEEKLDSRQKWFSTHEHLRVFELKKVSQRFDTWWKFRARIKEKLYSSNFEPSESYIQMSSRVNTSFEDFLSHLKDPRV